MIKSKGKYYSDIINRLKKVYLKEQLFESLNYFIRGLGVFIAWLFLSFVLEIIFRFGSDVRSIIFFITVFILFIALVGVPGYFLLARVLFSNYDNIYKTALKIGSAYSQIKDDLLNSIQLQENPGKNFSSELINASFQTVYEKCRNLQFTEVIKPRDYISSLKYILPEGLVIIIVLLLSVDFSNSFQRILNYNNEFYTPPRIMFEVKPGDANVTRGNELVIETKVLGEYESAVNINQKSEDRAEFESKRISTIEEGIYKYKIASVLSSLEYYLECDGFESERYRVTVINRPFVKSLKLVITPPAYSGLAGSVQLDNGSISGLKGTRIYFELLASKNLSNAELKFSESKIELKTEGKKSTCSFTLSDDAEYFINITDEQGIANTNPVEYYINIIPDNYPEIELNKPEDKLRVTSNQIVTQVNINDDFGFSKLILNYRLSASRYETPSEEFSTLSVPVEKKVLTQEVNYVWDITELFLAEGDVVSYYFEIYDNDNVSGPKSTKTGVQTLMVPSVNEFFNDADEIQDVAQQELKETLQSADKLQKEMQQLSNELKRDDMQLSFEEKNKIENVLSKYEDLSQKAADIADKLNEMQKDLMQNNLLSNETMQKYMELQNLMKEMQGNEFLDALREMQAQLENLLRNQSQQNFENLKMNENAFKESIERTLNLLKRLQVEQKVDEMIKRAENIKSKTEEIKEKLLSEKENNNGLTKRQENVSEELDDFKKAMEKLSEKMNELAGMPKEQLEKIKEEFENQNNQELSESVQENINQGNQQSANNSLSQMSNNMSQMSQMFTEMQEQMNNEMQMEMFYDMAKIINDLIQLSKDEEALKRISENTPPGSEELKNLASEQSKIFGNLDNVFEKISDLAQKSFVLTPEIAKALGSSKQDMQTAQTYLQNNSSGAAITKQRDAMKNINEAATLIKGAMNQMMNSQGQGGGMMSLMQQLKQMAQQQMDINQMTEMLRQQRMAQQQMAQMQKIAQEQETLRKSLAELNREARESGQSSKLASDLEKILDEMKEVVKDIRSNQLDDRLLQKQERILSRLLDAQTSMNERDYEKNRESVSGRNIQRSSPAGLKLNEEGEIDKLKEELRRALQEGYKKDYEELIKKYYEALEKVLKN